jgi:hypothetical protein
VYMLAWPSPAELSHLAPGQRVLKARLCDSYYGTITFNKNAATTFQDGVDLKGLIGIDLSAKSGRTSKQAVTMKYPNHKFRVCATTNLPGSDSSGALVAK